MIRASIVGFGNIGKAVYEAISSCDDIVVKSVVTSKEKIDNVETVKDVADVKDVDVAIICMPSRIVEETAAILLAKGISTVDSYDIHSSIADVRLNLDKIAKENNCAAITAAGWDPGSDSVIRTLFMAMVPKGITYTNFGPGMSMGHTVAAKAIKGVKNALSMTIPAGSGMHTRMVYVELLKGANFNQVSQAILKDDYFSHDNTHVIEVENVEMLKDVGHGVNLTRKGVSGVTGNQRIEFNMTINNPALTGQIMVSSARAVMKQKPGCYTMIQVPPIDFLSGDVDELVRSLV